MKLGLIVSACLVLTACDGFTAPARQSENPPPSITIAPSPASSRLPTPDEQRTFISSLAAAGVRGATVSVSKFDWLFGTGRSAVFTGTLDGRTVWADVHFLDSPMDGITACVTRTPSAEWSFTVAVKGRPQTAGGASVTGSVAGAEQMFFAASDRILVMTPFVLMRNALIERLPALRLSVPACIWREPETLSVFPWERDILDAFGAGGIEVRLIGGSKWESFLGDAHEARVFLTASATTSPVGADVLALQKTPAVRMCSSSSTQGFIKWSVTVDGRSLAGMEGSQTVYPLIGHGFFVLAWDRITADVLASRLGLNAPPC